MGHVEQYARPRARIRPRVLVSKLTICTIRTVLGTCNARTRARSDPYKSSLTRYSAWDSGASLTGSRLQG